MLKTPPDVFLPPEEEEGRTASPVNEGDAIADSPEEEEDEAFRRSRRRLKQHPATPLKATPRNTPESNTPQHPVTPRNTQQHPATPRNTPQQTPRYYHEGEP